MKKISVTNKATLILGLVMIIVTTALVIVSLLNPEPGYDELSEATVTIKEFQHYYKTRRGYESKIIVEDVCEYMLDGQFDVETLKSKLTAGKTANIKFYTKVWLGKTYYVEEIVVDGETLCSYSNDNEAETKESVWFLVVVIFVGITLVALSFGEKGRARRK